MHTPFTEVQSYLAQLPAQELRNAQHYTGQLFENGNPAFNNMAPDAFILAPSLITEEGSPAQKLDVIRAQGVAGAVAVSANLSLEGSKVTVAQRNLAEIIEYQHGYPDFPLSYFLAGYEVGTPIGGMVRELYSASLGHMAVTQGPALRNIPLIRWDFDTMEASPNYLSDVLTYWAADDEPNKLAYPTVQHDRLDAERFPNINRLLHWYDYTIALNKSFLSAHFAVDVVGYTSSRGLDADCAISEVGNIVEHMSRNRNLPELRLHHLAGAVARVSGRRIALRSATEGYPVYDALYMTSDDVPSHRNQSPAHDISSGDYVRQNGWRVLNAVQTVGDREYRRQIQNGATQEAAKAASIQHMHTFGTAAMRQFNDPPAMARVVEGAIRSWQQSGPPAGYIDRKRALIKIRPWNFKHTPGEEPAASVAAVGDQANRFTAMLPVTTLKDSAAHLTAAHGRLNGLSENTPSAKMLDTARDAITQIQARIHEAAKSLRQYLAAIGYRR